MLVQPETTTADSSNLDCGIAIVGGGIVGTTLAAAIKNSGFKIILIEARSPQSRSCKILDQEPCGTS